MHPVIRSNICFGGRQDHVDKMAHRHTSLRCVNMRRSTRRNRNRNFEAELFVRTDKEKGRCVHTVATINKGDIFLEYKGTLKEEEPVGDDTYIFEFFHKGKKLWVDATDEDDSFGRLVNDSVAGANCKVRVNGEGNTPSLQFVALRDILPNEEVLYNYGHGYYPWRTKKRKKEEPEREASPDFEHEPSPKPEREASPDFEHEPSPEPEREASPNFEHEPEREASPDFEHEPSPEPEREASPDFEHEPSLEPEREASPDFEREPSLEPECEASPDFEHEPSLEPECEASPDFEHEPSPEPEREASPDFEHEPSLEPECEASPDPELETSPEPERESSPDLEHEPSHEPERESSPDFEHEPSPEPECEASPDFERELSPEPECEASLDFEHEPSLEPECEASPDFEHEPSLEPKREASPDFEHELSLEPECEASPDPELETPPEPECEASPDENIEDRSTYYYCDDGDVVNDVMLKSDNYNDDADPDYKPSASDNTTDSEEENMCDNESDATEYNSYPSMHGFNGNENIQCTKDGSISDSCSECSDVLQYPSLTEKASTSLKPKLTVMQATKKEDGSRNWDKKHCCKFCLTLVAKLPRHFEQKHKDELEIVKVLSLPKKSAERKAQLRALMNEGDFLYNKKAISIEQGSLIPYKRPKASDPHHVSDYLPCKQCLGFFLRHDLWRHAKRCPKRDIRPGMKNVQHQAASAALLHNDLSKNDSFKKNIMSSMSNDEVSFIARHDELIVKLGERMYCKSSQQPHQYQYVKQKMREMARFLIEARKTNPKISKLADCIDPQQFPSVVQAVKTTCGFDEAVGKYNVPSLALKLGHSLKKCAMILKTDALLSANTNLKEKSIEFTELCENEWSTEVSSVALQNLHTETFNKPKRIPLAEDLKKLNVHLQSRAGVLVKLVEEDPDEGNWRELACVTLAQVVLFNRKRGGEAERLEVSQYMKGTRQQNTMQGEVASCLSDFEKKLAESLKRIEIRGKRGRCVPLLLTDKHYIQTEILVKTRILVGISHENKYVFARFGNAQFPLRSADVLRKYASECGAEQPELITSTSLRKHVATISQILNLKDNELDSLANFLGHDIRIHRQYYRLPEDTIQLAKVSKLLVEMENGTVQNHKGKSLDEIQIDVEEVLQGESDSGQSDNCEDEPNDTCQYPEITTIKVPSKKKTGERRIWSEEEKKAVLDHLGKYLVSSKLPGKAECLSVQKKAPILNQRPWQQIKFYIKNHKVV